MKNTIFLILFSVSLLSCEKEIPTVKHVQNNHEVLDLSTVKVINSEDPICKMNTAKYLKDTAVFNGNIYGFLQRKL